MDRIATLPFRNVNPKILIALTVAALLAIVFPRHALEATSFAFWNLVTISPVILIGLGLTAAITASGSMALIASAFEGREARMIAVASMIGAITPVCGVSVLPLVAGLLAARVPLAPIMAFWLSSPVTDPGMLAVTAATLGWPFALAKTVGAFAIGCAGGLATYALVRGGLFADPVRPGGFAASAAANACSCDDDGTIRWRFWNEASRRNQFRSTFLSNGRLMLIWLTLAFLAEYAMKLALPEAWVAGLVGGADNRWAVPLAVLVGAPIYLDGYAALPLVRGLLDAGMRPDAALAFLVAGGITSAWAAIPVFALVRLPVFLTYLALAVTGSLFVGWGFGLFTG